MAPPPLKFKDQLENNRHMAEATIETLGGKQLLSQKRNQKKKISLIRKEFLIIFRGMGQPRRQLISHSSDVGLTYPIRKKAQN